MAGNLTIDGTTATVTFTYTADVEKAQATIEGYGIIAYLDFPFYDENNEIIPFGDLTAQQKVDVVDKKIRDIIVSGANNTVYDSYIKQAQVDASNDNSIGLT